MSVRKFKWKVMKNTEQGHPYFQTLANSLETSSSHPNVQCTASMPQNLTTKKEKVKIVH